MIALPTNLGTHDVKMPSRKHADAQADSNTDYAPVLSNDKSMPIAIIGMGFRGPADATDVNGLWKMILEGREGFSPVPQKRWNNAAFYHPDHARHGTTNVHGGHFLSEDVDLFDAPFFNMTGDEAAAMDPQQRLLLEVTYEALENAGIPLPNITGSETSCFVGSFNADYTDMLLRDPEFVSMYQCTNAGQSRAMTANRVSYFFDLKGPSITVDTACSGSLVGLHLACQSLKSGDVSMAIAAGVNLVLSHEFMTTMSMMKFLSPDGRCYTFDENANGYARGEAIGCLLLKPLKDAIRDNDTIRAVIRGTGSNQDGRTQGITLPSGTAQEALIRHVYHSTGLDPRETEFIETHGTGTQAGDPIETGALSRVFSPGRPLDAPLRLGSIKSNVGHLEGTSGIAGVIKAVLMLENRVFLPNRNLKTINPRIPLDEWNLKVQLTPEPWESKGPHRVSVNSFGYGGSNAHVIVEDIQGYATNRNMTVTQRKWQQTFDIEHINGELARTSSKRSGLRKRIYTLSGFDEATCKSQIRKLGEYVLREQSNIDESFSDNLAFSLNERRTNLTWKAAVIGDSTTNVAEALMANVKPKRAGKKPSIGFVFTGQGAQWSGMGKELVETYPVFRESMNRCDLHLEKIGAPFNIQEEILKSKETSRLSHPLLSQTTCSALQIALVDLFSSWGIFPDSVTGHSSGEIAAAYAIGALSLEDAMSVAYYRGVAASKLQTQTDGHGKGGMMAVGMSAEDAQLYLNDLRSGKAVVACVNSPSSVTISGDITAIEELEKVFSEKQVFNRRLTVEVAYHSHHMKAVAHEYFTSIASITSRSETDARPDKKTILYFSSVTGTEAKAPDLGPQYWVSNLLNQVKFGDSVNALCFETGSLKNASGKAITKRQKRVGATRKPSIDLLIEIGPHSALAAPIKQILKADPKLDAADIMYSTALARFKDAVASTLNLVAILITAGYSTLDFAAINRPVDAGHRQKVQLLVDLPPYAWNHSRSYWAESRLSKMYRNRKYPRTDLLGVPDRMACPVEPRWRNYLRISEIPWLEDHKIQSNIVYPAAGYITMAIEALLQHALDNNADRNVAGYYLRDIRIQSALVISETSAAEVMVSLQKSESSSHSDFPETAYRFRVYSVSEDNRWKEHCKGLIGVEHVKSDSEATILERLEDTVKGGFEADISDLHGVDIQPFYRKLAAVGLEYGHCFANLTAAHLAGDTCIAEITNPDTAAVMPMNFEHPVLIHPCTLDSIFHTIFVGLLENMDLDDEPPIPISIDELYVSQNANSEPGHKMDIRTSVRSSGRRGDIVASIVVTDAGDAQEVNGGPVVCISGLTCRSLAQNVGSSKTKQRNRIAYNLEWKADPDLLSADKASKILASVRGSSVHQQLRGTKETEDLYERCAIYYIKKALKTIDPAGPTKLKPHINRQLSFFVEVNRQYEDSGGEGFSAESVKSSGAKGELLCAVGEELPALLNEETSILTVVQNKGRLGTYWEDTLHSTQGYETACRYLDLVSHKDPMISVLEVGSGTGKSSLRFLERLSAHNSDIPRCQKYTITSSDPAVFESAAQELLRWSNWYDLKQLDIEGDLEAQSFQSDQYDVVIVPHGIYGASSIQKVLDNIHVLLKPGGHLILVDPIANKNSLADKTIFGNFSDSLEDSAFGLSQSQWNDSLLGAKFTGVDVFFECEDRGSTSGCSVILSSASRQPSSSSTDVLIVTEESDNGVSAKHLQELLSQVPLNSETATFADANPAGRTCIVLNELQSSLLARPDDSTLSVLKQIFLQSEGVLWVSRGGTALIDTEPDASLVMGFARTMRSESGVNPIVTLDLDSNSHLSDKQAVRIIFDLFKYRFFHKSSGLDTEFAERDGILCIPRVIENSRINETVLALQDNFVVSDRIFDQADRPLRVTVGDDVTNDGSALVHFTKDSRIAGLPPGYVRIQVKAIGLNEKDVHVLTGQAQQGTLLGSECSGIVHSIGDGVDGFAIGDRVACLGLGTAVNFYEDHASVFQKLPDSMPFDLAAAIPVVYSTGYHVVHNLARISSDDSVLIHGAADPCGQAVADTCRLKGAEIFATVTAPAQRDMLSSRFGIPEDQIFIGSDGIPSKPIMELTNNNGVDVIVTTKIDHRTLRQSWNCIAPHGRFVQLGSQDLSQLSMPFKNNITIAAVNLPSLVKEKPGVVAKVSREALSLFRAKALQGPSALTTYRISGIGDALQALNAGKHHNDKVVVTVAPKEVVKATLKKKTHSLLRHDASYMLVGGLGGIGRAIGLWMVEHGAKNLIFVNRSGMVSEAAKETVNILEQKDVNAIVRSCDISDNYQVQRMMDDLSKVAPPIQGVMQAAAVFKDVHFEQMTAEDYNRVLQPKYAGTWNLHLHLPKHLDFFIMLSSVSGIIGNATQAAYAAGSTFMDAFARYRNSLGLHAVSLDLGVITDAGYLAETNTELAAKMAQQGFQGMNTKTLMYLIETAITTTTAAAEAHSQIITGLGEWKEGQSLGNLDSPIFAQFRRQFLLDPTHSQTADQKGASSDATLREDLKSTKSLEDASGVIYNALCTKFAAHLSISVEEVNPETPISDLGIDSHVAVELRNWIAKKMESTVPILEILASGSLVELAGKIAGKSSLVNVPED